MSVTTIVFLCLAIAYLLLKFPRKRESTSENKLPASRKLNPYSATSIRAKGCACAAAMDMADSRFLTANSPLLPLPDCDALKCDCRYVHHEDQRARGDRRALFGMQADVYILEGQPERRIARGRRKTEAGTYAASNFSLDDIEWNT